MTASFLIGYILAIPIGTWLGSMLAWRQLEARYQAKWDKLYGDKGEF